MKRHKKPITSTLKNLNVNEEFIYHKKQRLSVTTIRDRLQKTEPKKWRLSKVDNRHFKVTRTS